MSRPRELLTLAKYIQRKYAGIENIDYLTSWERPKVEQFIEDVINLWKQYGLPTNDDIVENVLDEVKIKIGKMISIYEEEEEEEEEEVPTIWV